MIRLTGNLKEQRDRDIVKLYDELRLQKKSAWDCFDEIGRKFGLGMDSVRKIIVAKRKGAK